MKVLSSHIKLNSNHHQQVEYQAQLDVSLEKGGDTVELSQTWELNTETASTQSSDQVLSDDTQQKSLALLGKLRKLSDIQANRSAATPLTTASEEQASSRRPHPQDPLRASINPAGKLNRGRRVHQVPTLTEDQVKDAKLYTFSLLVSKLTQKTVYLSKINNEQVSHQTGNQDLLNCEQSTSNRHGLFNESGEILRSFYGIDTQIETSTQEGQIARTNTPDDQATRNVFNGFSRFEAGGKMNSQRLRLEIGDISEGVNQGETIEVRYTEERIESECLNVSGCGRVTLADGREISFDLDMSLERCSVQKLELEISNRELKDPLIIDFGAEVARFTDHSFEFDLDADGEMDSMSALDSQGGILVIDHNQDGVVNDGSEVVGALSSDAFGDLRSLDDDQNGWIDEDDQIYDQLRVWTWNEDGSQELLSLSQANVGAIYLGAVDAQFSHHTDDDQFIAQQRFQSIYLKESGEVGSARQVDVVA